MAIIDWPRLYRVPDEAKCQKKAKYLFDRIFFCRKCRSTEFRYNAQKSLYECKTCLYRSSIKSYTIMRRSKLPYSYWIYAVDRIYNDDTPRKQLAEELNGLRLATVYDLSLKIREELVHSRGVLDEEIQKFIWWKYFDNPTKTTAENGLIEVYLKWLIASGI